MASTRTWLLVAMLALVLVIREAGAEAATGATIATEEDGKANTVNNNVEELITKAANKYVREDIGLADYEQG
ncbi:hypothetical protein J5N97_008181 [Dioscorea zingiberensis]|uniref:Uncharacterized protein n=1 Tax=Dioscorea zingiberensis TaxID=325984 RepID=A0A9D5DDM9_9LILI|nr:hypothetical protein J5N97_008181 [Dioscorea zingiberensis]